MAVSKINFAIVLVAGLAASAYPHEPAAALLADWQKTVNRIDSLVVEFTLREYDPSFGDHRQADGMLRMLRDAKGEVLASYDLVWRKPDKSKPFKGMLNNGVLYMLEVDEKVAYRYRPSDGEVRRFLADSFNPFVWFLHRQHAEARFNLVMTKQDERQTYLAVEPKSPSPAIRSGRIVLLRKKTEHIPKGMPCQLGYRNEVVERTFDIKSWRMNAADPPPRVDFMVPEKRMGWRVEDMNRIIRGIQAKECP